MKETWKDLGFKDRMAYTSAALSFILGWILIFIGFCVDPMGEVDASVITIFGISLTYVGTVLGIALHFNNQLVQFKNEIKNDRNNRD